MEEIKFKRDKHFEECIIQAMLIDHSFAEQMMDVLNIDYFNLEFLKEVAKLIFNYYNKYSTIPSLKLLASIVKKEIESDLLKSQMMEYFISIKKNPLNGDMDYVKEESLDFCKKRSLAIALENSLTLIKEKNYEAIVDEIQKAILAGSEKDVGHNLNKDLKKRILQIDNNPIPTGWSEIDRITRGGPGAGKLCSILASTGCGKSHALVDLGAAMAKKGLNVVHYTFELLSEEIGLRYDSNISDIEIDEIKNNENEVQISLDKLKGNVIIRAYPMYSASALTIKNHVRQLTLRDLKPDVIIIDYADLMRSRRKFDQLRLEQQHIYGELKALSKELEVPIWTATQSNRDGVDLEILKAKNVGESWGKVQISDLFITMSRKQEKNPVTTGYFYVAKNRLGPDGMAFPIRVQTAKSKIEVLSSIEQEEINNNSELDKASLRKKFAELSARLEKEEN
jgi:replicative DNA helicase